MLSTAEATVLRVFRDYLVTPGEMLCFHGDLQVKHERALRSLTEKELLQEESFPGGYSLTGTGYAAMRQHQPEPSE